MSQYREQQEEDEVERLWEEARRYRGWMENIGPSTKSRNVTPPFCVPLSISMVPSLTESDESSQYSRDLSRASMPPPSPRQQQASQSMIEISPGVHVRLRGADETWKAIEQDYYMPTECLCCQVTIFCIQNAEFVLCPDCRVVSRMEDSSSQGMGGVGLGFKYEDLARWQADILRRQEEEQRPRRG